MSKQQQQPLHTMASAARQWHWCRTAQRQIRTPWRQPHRLITPTQLHHRNFNSTRLLLAEESDDKDSSSSNQPYFNQAFFNRLDADDRAAYRTYTPSERQQMEKVEEALRDEFAKDSRTHRELEDMMRAELQDLEQEFPDRPVDRPPPNNGFFQMGEKEDIGPDEDDFQGDDMSSTGHGELEQHREIREYARLAGWEMPLLANLAKPFTPPTTSTPLRFRYTSYLGEQHPASHKVVVEFSPSDLSLTPSETANLIKLSGPRYNPSTQIIKISSEAHESQAQNKRYLGDTIASLLAKAKDPATTSLLQNLPFDFRHDKQKQKLSFPQEWLLTEERKAMLEQKRATLADQQKLRLESPVGLVDGVKEIEDSRNIDLARVEEPVLEKVRQPMAKGKQDKRAMLRGKA